MMTLAEKIATARYNAGLSQQALADQCDVTKRMVAFYEAGDKKPRMKTILKMAKAMNVSVKYLTDSECDNPKDGLEDNPYVEQVYEEKGTKEAISTSEILSKTAALMAGGEIPQEEKDIFAQAMIAMLETCSAEAKRKFTPKKYQENDEKTDE